MKNLNQIVNFGILILCVSAALFWGFSQRSEKLRYKNNWQASVQKNGQQTFVTEMEYSRLYEEIDSLTRELGLKPKNVSQVIKANYIVEDSAVTVVQIDTIIRRINDTVYVFQDTTRIDIERPCYHLTGYLIGKEFKHELEYRDSPTIVIERQRSKRIWFVKYGPWQYSAMFYSQCSNKLMWIEENILISRK